MNFELRPARPEDQTETLALLSHLGYPGLEGARVSAVYGELLRSPDAAVSLALAAGSGEPIGLLVLSFRPCLHLAGTLGCIDELSVAPEARGLGVGAGLLARALEQARGRGALRVELSTRRSRESYLRGFYRKNGFEEADSALFRRLP